MKRIMKSVNSILCLKSIIITTKLGAIYQNLNIKFFHETVLAYDEFDVLYFKVKVRSLYWIHRFEAG